MNGKPLEPRVVHRRDESGRPVCGAKTRPGARHSFCHRIDLNPENGRCRLHGGLSPGGPLKHGLYSKRLPGRIGELAALAEADGDLEDMRRPLPALQAIAVRMLEIAHDNDSPRFRERALELAAEIQRAEDPRPLVQALVNHLERGANETRALVEGKNAMASFSERQEGFWRIALSQRHAWTTKQVSGLALRILESARAFMDEATHRKFATQVLHDALGPGEQRDLSGERAAEVEPAAVVS